MLVAVDAGKYASKSLSSRGRSYIRTRLESTNESVAGSNSYVVEYEDGRYLVGAEAEGASYDTTKRSLIHKVLTYLSVATHLPQDIGSRVDLVVGTPLTEFLNATSRESYKAYLRSTEPVTLLVNGRIKSFRLDNVTVLPESLGLLYRDSSLYRNKLVAVIDIGGLNSNGAIYNNLKPIKDSVFTLNEGSGILNTKIKSLLNTRYGLNYQDYEIPHVVQNGARIDGMEVAEAKELIAELLDAHLERILTEGKRRNWNLRSLDVIFTGGGSLLLSEAIAKKIPHATVSASAVYDNVEGFYRAGEALYGVE